MKKKGKSKFAVYPILAGLIAWFAGATIFDDARLGAFIGAVVAGGSFVISQYLDMGWLFELIAPYATIALFGGMYGCLGYVIYSGYFGAVLGAVFGIANGCFIVFREEDLVVKKSRIG